ncbi:DoxX family protein [Solirubrobacter sp. CPCC 204708]|uniref:DoxX family protein n=1 Tax=Solirubrobacter deserti TaxID=2282478 RepID=A0ABT4RT39_9ACTN|nr:DoxX family protein [Solirubrobacter deserti]MBE2315693.1 DoxX family protein [Solirubrobacter deserti]MDA0141729.1 DoxX family protein [Solirubrobacter deserti]
MTDPTATRPVAMQRGRHANRMRFARLRAAWSSRPEDRAAAGLLLLRIAVGATFLAHGLDKLADLDGTERFFDSLGIPWPAAMAPLVGVTETVGGLLLIAGAAVPWIALALAGDMAVAFLTAHLGHGFFATEGGGELVLLLGAACLALALSVRGARRREQLRGRERAPDRHHQLVRGLSPRGSHDHAGVTPPSVPAVSRTRSGSTRCHSRIEPSHAPWAPARCSHAARPTPT